MSTKYRDAEVVRMFIMSMLYATVTRSQALARIADRTAWQLLWGHRSRDVIGHV